MASVWIAGNGGWRLQRRGGLQKEEDVPEDENKSRGRRLACGHLSFLMSLAPLLWGSKPGAAFPPHCFILSHSTSLVFISCLCRGPLRSKGKSGSLCPHRSQPVRMQTANKCSQHSTLSVMARKEVSKEIATMLGPERQV